MAVLTEMKIYSSGDFLSNRLGFGRLSGSEDETTVDGVVFIQ